MNAIETRDTTPEWMRGNLHVNDVYVSGKYAGTVTNGIHADPARRYTGWIDGREIAAGSNQAEIIAEVAKASGLIAT
jgi:hypothetical protein